MADRYQIRRRDNNLYYFTRSNKKDAFEILRKVEETTKIEHYVYDTVKQKTVLINLR